MEGLSRKPFSALDPKDAFFDGLRESCNVFDRWFEQKADAGCTAWVGNRPMRRALDRIGGASPAF
jgi:hypothetical protein